jgi:hypothetical protein
MSLQSFEISSKEIKKKDYLRETVSTLVATTFVMIVLVADTVFAMA